MAADPKYHEEKFEKYFGAANLAALYSELIYHEGLDADNDPETKFYKALYSAANHSCLHESDIGTLDEKKFLLWVYENVYYGYIAEAVGEPETAMHQVFQSDKMIGEWGGGNEDDEDEDDDEEEDEEEAPRPTKKTGIARFDHLLT